MLKHPSLLPHHPLFKITTLHSWPYNLANVPWVANWNQCIPKDAHNLARLCVVHVNALIMPRCSVNLSKKRHKKVSDTSFPQKGDRQHKWDREHKSDKSHKRRKYKSEDSDSSADKKYKKVKDKSTKIKITKQDSESDDEFAHVFMFCGDDDDNDTILDDPYWTQPSIPSCFISHILLVRHPHLH